MNNNYILETHHLTKEFKGFTAVDDVSLNIQRGHIHALIGPNGAGKTTVFNLLTKYLSPTSGTILFNGRDITAIESSAIARQGLVRSFQISAVFPNLTVLENVRVALQQREGNSFHFWKPESVLDRLNERAEQLLESVGLQDFARVVTVDLSYGRKRALEIATTLALDPEMLLLDEPTQGMGQEDVERTANLIRSVADNRTILMVEHNLKVVSQLADRITVLQRGAVLTEGDYATVSDDPRVREAYLGVAADKETAA
ncbi:MULTISPECIES: ABC transporter ATP-binding protein [unclassified Oceanobacter]|jgi:branched-chain amino acid transport system ATP-binding protein|uniref:ABC transporter ATP-binding protein n=1 Tax=unclassified Oceanobacter TaxID=2620260 RepID=UPI0026E24418|nr:MULTISPECIES: ABC transporter ATP-binding protein [unclassified Oceanobacter]MDO6681399.1 ABC transporter ATP-binding protein [Oceanobacter sp. 5_MG-2023]MDP2608154.1 ABC transporter ATP-binding protein [Oceanobacter sp. 1_MG-2023]MDP2611184.1 ABC transporter ATP-binding protein [Oceanobacter sp. 2_MG-2023]